MSLQTQAAAKKFNVPYSTVDAMDVITHPEVDAVWICSPSQFHADQVRPWVDCGHDGKAFFVDFL